MLHDLKGANVFGSTVCITLYTMKCTHSGEKENSLFMNIFLRNAKWKHIVVTRNVENVYRKSNGQEILWVENVFLF